MQILAVLPEWAKQHCFTDEAWQKLAALGPLTWQADMPREGDAAPRFAAHDPATEILVTGWGTPRLTPAVLAQLPKLRLIAHSAGSVAGVALEAWQRGVRVTHVMPVMALGVAEFTVTCILTGLRRFDALLKPELFNSIPFFTVPNVGFMLRGKTIGLVGLGIIGREVARLLKAFGCNLLVYDPYLKPEAAREVGATLCDLDTLMARSDVVSLHAPGTEACKNIIDLRRLKMLKPGAILVNTARGILLDHDALATVAAEGKIGVYLDVTLPEPLPPDHPLRKLPNVVLTPHIAGPTTEGWPMMGDACVADVARFIKGEPLKYEVTAAQYANQSTS